MQALKQTRESQLDSLVNLGEEKASTELRLKQNSDASSQMLRQMYEDLRGQLENEVTFRTKNEEDLRNWFESKSEMLSQIQQRSE